jgi:hypothetical protein
MLYDIRVGECAYFELYGTSGMIIFKNTKMSSFMQVTRCSRRETVAWSLYNNLVSDLMIKKIVIQCYFMGL